MIQCVLWDIDGTLLDFLKAEEYGIRCCFEKFGMGECTDEMLKRYSAINRKWWERLERGEYTKPQILEGRFAEFFQSEGLPCDHVAEFNVAYQYHLGDHVFFKDGAQETVDALKGSFAQYAVTNGTALAQERKLRQSGLDQMLDGIFISEKVGFDKPDLRFFEAVFSAIPYRPEDCIIIGDSLSGDIQGGMNAGIRNCWLAAPDASIPARYQVDHRISSLREVPALLKKINKE